jgi:gluconokinase
MQSGKPLTDDDRWPWLASMNKCVFIQVLEWLISCKIVEWIQRKQKTVLACSALRKAYRDALRHNLSIEEQNSLFFVYLKGSKEMILKRIQERKNHFMSSSLLDSQVSVGGWRLIGQSFRLWKNQDRQSKILSRQVLIDLLKR